MKRGKLSYLASDHGRSSGYLKTWVSYNQDNHMNQQFHYKLLTLALLLLTVALTSACPSTGPYKSDQAENNREELYERGRRNIQSPRKIQVGIQQLKRAAALGDSRAMGELAAVYLIKGYSYIDEYPELNDIDQGLSYAEKGMALGDPKSSIALGWRYCTGSGVPLDCRRGHDMIMDGLDGLATEPSLMICSVAAVCANSIKFESNYSPPPA